MTLKVLLFSLTQKFLDSWPLFCSHKAGIVLKE